MTDKEIIKALERCGQHRECCYCNSVEECGNKRVLTASALDLINRQQAEIEKKDIEIDILIRKKEALNDEVSMLRAEIERLQSMNQAKLDIIHDLMTEVERLKQPVLVAENVEINKEELLEKLQQTPIQILPGKKHYELRDCPFSPFDEYCTGHCVNCENRLECVDCSKRLKAEAYKEFERKSEKRLIELYEKYHKIANKPWRETDMFYQGRAEAIWECISTNRDIVKEMMGE